MAVQFVATVTTLPWSYTILGLVLSTREAMSGSEKVKECITDIQRQAEARGAKAIIGLQITFGMDSPKKIAQHMVTTVAGTAVTWADPASAPPPASPSR